MSSNQQKVTIHSGLLRLTGGLLSTSRRLGRRTSSRMTRLFSTRFPSSTTQISPLVIRCCMFRWSKPCSRATLTRRGWKCTRWRLKRLACNSFRIRIRGWECNRSNTNKTTKSSPYTSNSTNTISAKDRAFGQARTKCAAKQAAYWNKRQSTREFLVRRNELLAKMTATMLRILSVAIGTSFWKCRSNRRGTSTTTALPLLNSTSPANQSPHTTCTLKRRWKRK